MKGTASRGLLLYSSKGGDKLKNAKLLWLYLQENRSTLDYLKFIDNL